MRFLGHVFLVLTVVGCINFQTTAAQDSIEKSPGTKDIKESSSPAPTSFELRRRNAYRVSRRGTRRGILESIRILEKVLSDTEELYPQGHREVFLTGRDLAERYFHAKRFQDAVEMQQKVYDCCRKLYPSENWPEGFVETVESTMLLGRYHLTTKDGRGEFEKYMRLCVDLIDQAPMEPDLAIADMRAQIAMGLKRSGQSELANEFCLKAADIADGLINDASQYDKVTIIQIYWLCASQFFDVANVAQSKKYAAKAVELWKEQGVPAPLQMKTESLQVLGACHTDEGEYEEAIKCLERAHALIKGFDPHNAAGIAINLANAHLQLGDLDAADQWLSRGKSYEIGTQRPIRYRYIEAQLLASRGKNEQAYELLLESLKEQQRDPIGTDKTASAYALLGELESKRGEHESAAKWLEKARTSQMSYLQRFLTRASEAATLNYLHYDWKKITDTYLQVTRHAPMSRQIKHHYELVSQQRGIVVRALALRNSLRRNLRGEGRERYREYLEVSNALAAMIENGARPEIGNPSNKLQLRKDLLEAELAEHAPDLLNGMRDLSVPVNQLQQSLGKNEMVIHFVRYSQGKESMYAVFGLTRDVVHRTDLNDSDKLREQIHNWRRDIAKGHGEQLAKEIYSVVWRPLQDWISESIDTIYVCGDGTLLLLPWSALQREDDSILLEHFAIATPPYPQHLLRRSHRDSGSTKRLLAVGDVALDTETDQSGTASNGNSNRWRRLDHTKSEIASLRDRAESAGVTVRQLDGKQATATNVVNELPESYWAHFATHGFHQPHVSATRRGHSSPIVSDQRHPLVRKGLVLAGANSQSPEGRLSGATICNLDLRKTELVFLSACDTAVGDVFDDEGVFGLQRAFHAAGAKNVICSLWQIDDAATALLVQKFYENYWSGRQSPLQALRKAQLELYRNPLLLEQFKENHRSTFHQTRGLKFQRVDGTARQSSTSPPALWAGFIFSGTEPISK